MVGEWGTECNLLVLAVDIALIDLKMRIDITFERRLESVISRNDKKIIIKVNNTHCASSMTLLLAAIFPLYYDGDRSREVGYTVRN